MDEKTLTQLLSQVKGGKVSVDEAVGRLKDLPFAELGYATLDTHRSLRFGAPWISSRRRSSRWMPATPTS